MPLPSFGAIVNRVFESLDLDLVDSGGFRPQIRVYVIRTKHNLRLPTDYMSIYAKASPEDEMNRDETET